MIPAIEAGKDTAAAVAEAESQACKAQHDVGLAWNSIGEEVRALWSEHDRLLEEGEAACRRQQFALTELDESLRDLASVLARRRSAGAKSALPKGPSAGEES